VQDPLPSPAATPKHIPRLLTSSPTPRPVGHDVRSAVQAPFPAQRPFPAQTPTPHLVAYSATVNHSLQLPAPLAVAYSGGVDSTLLLKLALDQLGADQVIAVLAISPSLPKAEADEAIHLAQHIGVKVHLLHTTETDDPRYIANAPNRCYFCKDHVYKAIATWAQANGYPHVADGMNAEDTLDLRPGRAAAKEQGILSPLHAAGYTKAMIRAEAQRLGLPNWNKPAAACLASRIPYGSSVTPAKLSQIEQAEAILKHRGFKEVRVRHHENLARIEVPDADLSDLLSQKSELTAELKQLGYTYISVDLIPLRQGSSNEVLLGRSSV
jgi:pyridinium-3,5-biscarboxylic acid mononucleotide sulfurtransferase